MAMARVDYENEGLSELGVDAISAYPGEIGVIVCIGATIGKAAVFQWQDISANQQINVSHAKREGKLIISRKFLSLPDDFQQTFQERVMANRHRRTLPIINENEVG